MKTKISITLDDELISEIDDATGNRSSFIEMTIKKYFEQRERRIRDERDLQLINEHADILNKEADEFLSFQVDI